MGRRYPFIFNNFYIFKIMGKNEIGNNRADSKKSVESKNCDELIRHGCTNKETRLYLKESPRSCEKELKSNDIDNI